jgi:phage shock protein A
MTNSEDSNTRDFQRQVLARLDSFENRFRGFETFQHQVLEQLSALKQSDDQLRQDIEQLSQKVDQDIERLSQKVDQDIERLGQKVDRSDEKFTTYQQGIQWVVQLAFTLIASATLTVIVTAVLKR